MRFSTCLLALAYCDKSMLSLAVLAVTERNCTLNHACFAVLQLYDVTSWSPVFVLQLYDVTCFLCCSCMTATVSSRCRVPATRRSRPSTARTSTSCRLRRRASASCRTQSASSSSPAPNPSCPFALLSSERPSPEKQRVCSTNCLLAVHF